MLNLDRPKLLIVNGPAGVGKTTTASLLAHAYAGSAHVRGDDLKGFVVNKSAATLNGATYRSGARVCSELLESGYRFIVFDFVFNTGEQVAKFWESVNTSVSFDQHFVTLWAEVRTITDRRSLRIEDPRYGEISDDSRSQLSLRLDQLQPILHTDGLAPEQVVQRLVEDFLS